MSEAEGGIAAVPKPAASQAATEQAPSITQRLQALDLMQLEMLRAALALAKSRLAFEEPDQAADLPAAQPAPSTPAAEAPAAAEPAPDAATAEESAPTEPAPKTAAAEAPAEEATAAEPAAEAPAPAEPALAGPALAAPAAAEPAPEASAEEGKARKKRKKGGRQRKQGRKGPIDVLVIDLDGCLYPIENGYEAHVRDNIFDFMHQRLGVPRDQAEAIWRPLFKQTNQSLKGLRVGGYAFQTDEYWDFIRKDADKFLKPDPEVRACLQSLPQRKWLFTNCNEKHAGIALEMLGLRDQFDGILGADFMGEFCKPDPEAFEKVFKHIGTVPSRTAMFEDSLKNLVQAKKLGLTTVLIAGKTALEEQGSTASALDQTMRPKAVDAVISKPCKSELRQHLPQLWKS